MWWCTSSSLISEPILMTNTWMKFIEINIFKSRFLSRYKNEQPMPKNPHVELVLISIHSSTNFDEFTCNSKRQKTEKAEKWNHYVKPLSVNKDLYCTMQEEVHQNCTLYGLCGLDYQISRFSWYTSQKNWWKYNLSPLVFKNNVCTFLG